MIILIQLKSPKLLRKKKKRKRRQLLKKRKRKKKRILLPNSRKIKLLLSKLVEERLKVSKVLKF